MNELKSFFLFRALTTADLGIDAIAAINKSLAECCVAMNDKPSAVEAYRKVRQCLCMGAVFMNRAHVGLDASCYWPQGRLSISGRLSLLASKQAVI